MTPRENFIMALERKQPGDYVPHFELVFFLTMEALNKVHPLHRNFLQWKQMSKKERQLHREDIADVYIETARKYEHSAIFFHPAGGWDIDKETLKCLEIIRQRIGEEYFTMIHGDATYAIPEGNDIVRFVDDIADKPQFLKDRAQKMVDDALKRARLYQKRGLLDGYALCSDYALNQSPFLSPAMFDEFVQPYLKRLIAGYKEMGFYTIKHSDGNILPILDSILDAAPDALHSLDPQAGIDIADLKGPLNNKVCLIGNVNCGLMDTGTDKEVAESARYALEQGKPRGGYIFSTSNCIYTGMNLQRYELIWKIWKEQRSYYCSLEN